MQQVSMYITYTGAIPTVRILAGVGGPWAT